MTMATPLPMPTMMVRQQHTGEIFTNDGIDHLISILNGVVTAKGFSTSAGAAVMTIAGNTAAAYAISDGTTSLMVFDTRNTASAQGGITLRGPAQTIASAATVTVNNVTIPALTVTLSGNTGISTAMEGISLNIGAPTLSAAMALTVTTASTLTVALPIAGGAGPTTITNAYTAHFLGAVRLDGTLDQSAQATTQKIIANTAAAVTWTDGTTNLVAFDTRTTVTGVTSALFTAPAQTIAGAIGTTYSAVGIAAHTLTTSTMTTITALAGLGLNIGATTVAQSGGAVTVTTASLLFVGAVTAGAMVTITNNNPIDSTSGGHLTSAGVWTAASHEFLPDGTTWKIRRGDPETLFGGSVLDAVRSIAIHRYDVTGEVLFDRDGQPWRVGERDRKDHIGYFAEELHAISPALSSDGEGVDGVSMSAFNTLAIQRLLEKVDALEHQLAHA